MNSAKMLYNMLWPECHYEPVSKTLCILATKGVRTVLWLGDVPNDRITIELTPLRTPCKIYFDITEDGSSTASLFIRTESGESSANAICPIPVHIFTPAV